MSTSPNEVEIEDDSDFEDEMNKLSDNAYLVVDMHEANNVEEAVKTIDSMIQTLQAARKFVLGEEE